MSQPFKYLSATLIVLCACAAAAVHGATPGTDYQAIPDWLKLPPGRPEPAGLFRQVGNMHGDIAVSSNGDVYVSVQALDKNNQPLTAAEADPLAGLQVYAANGKFLRNVPGAPTNLHGFIIRKEAGGEFLYGARTPTGPTEAEQARAGVAEQTVVKMGLDGKVVLAIPASAIPDQYKNKNPADGKPIVRITGVAVGPNGDIYAADGYSSDYIHRFDRTGKYLASFGGKGDPYRFNTLHKLALDTRFTPARLIACDRANNRVVHLSLDGELLGVVATDLQLPAAIAVHGDYAAIGELKGRVTLLDKAGQVVARLGANTVADEAGTKLIDPAKWHPGIVLAPHGIAFNEGGDIFVAEFSIFGRVDRFNRRN